MLLFTFLNAPHTPPFVLHPSLSGLQQLCRAERHVCSLWLQEELAESWQSQRANMFMQSRPHGGDAGLFVAVFESEMGSPPSLSSSTERPLFTTVILVSRPQVADRCFLRARTLAFHQLGRDG